MHRPPTPARPNAAKPSIVNSQYPGGAWKAKPDDDIPSDESDTGNISPLGARQRTRVRKRRGTRTTPVPMHIPLPGQGGVPSTSQWCSRSDVSSYTTVKSTNASSITEKQHQKNVKKALFSVPSSSQSKSHAPNSKSSSTTAPKNNCDQNNSLLRKPSSETRVSDKTKQSGRALNDPAKSVAIREVPRVPITQHKVANDWVFYTVWNPAWDVIWKCDSGKSSLLRNKDFCKLITEIIINNTGPDFDGSYDFKVMRVKGTDEAEGNFKIVGVLEADALNGKKFLKYRPSSRILEQLYKAVVSSSDIIVQCVPKLSSNPKRKTCIVHLTSKDGNKVDFCEILRAIHVELAMYNIKYEHYVPKIVKCSPFLRGKLRRAAEIDEQQRIPSPLPVVEPPQNTTAPSIESTSSSVSPGAVPEGLYATGDQLPAPASEMGSAPCVAMAIVGEDAAGEANTSTTQSNLNAQTESEQFPVDDDVVLLDIAEAAENELAVATNTEAVSQNLNSTRKVFVLNEFVKSGAFVPGPLRPKAIKVAKSGYVYNTLAELSSMLSESISKDYSKGLISNMMIKHQCNAYGIVNKIVPQSRHVNAYFVRISDETMDSVLLRIHTVKDDKNGNTGPIIDVGNIIRVHRLTVQMEWDTDKADNTVVLSTSSHSNYLLFEPSSEEYQFYFNSCAKTVTLTESDMKRVGELHLFKSNRVRNRYLEAPKVLHHNIIDDEHRASSHKPNASRAAAPENEPNSQGNEDQDSPTSLVTDGICTSELLSPPDTISTVSNSRNESFHSASEEVMQPETVNNTGLESSHNPEQEAESCSILQAVEPESLRFTNFHDLAKSDDESLNLLCQVKGLYTSETDNTFHLLLRDFEGTIPPYEFQTNLTPEVCEGQNNYLVLNIANADAFQSRNIFPEIYDAVGTEEFYFIENVNVLGTEAPQVLELDGRTCELKRCLNVLKVYNMDGTFANNTANTRLEIEDVQVVDREDAELGQDLAIEPQAHVTPTSSDRDEDEGENMVEGVPESTYASALQSPCSSPVQKSTRKRNYNCSAENEDHEDNWTGRLRHKRQPREHYQPEKSFEC